MRTARAALLLALLLAPCTGVRAETPEVRPNTFLLAGVSVAGGEFGRLPGVLGRDYAYPSDSVLDYFLRSGATALRVPFRWERVQPQLGGPLAPADLAELDRVVNRVTGHGARVVLDMHNYGRRAVDGSERVIAESGGAVTAAHLADAWRRLAERYGHEPRVVFGIMNEPHDQDGPTWVETQNAAVAAIRATSAANLVLVTGIAYSGAHSWERSGNAHDLLKARDPSGNAAFEAHQYLDANNSGFYENRGGSSASCSPGSGARRLQPFTDWLRREGRKGFLGEFGAPDDPRCLAELRDLYAHLAANADLYLGAAGWAAFGQPGYVLNLDPPPAQPEADTPIFTLLRRDLLGRSKPLAILADLPAAVGSGSAYPGGRLYGIGGLPGYRYDLAEGALPEGLTLDPASGRVAGGTVTAAAGRYTLTPRVTDAQGQSARGAPVAITVAPASSSPYDAPTVTHFGYTNRAISSHSFRPDSPYALVAVAGRDLDRVRGVTCGGIAMTRLARSFSHAVAGVAVYGLAAPSPGAAEIVVDLGQDYKLVSVVVQGVDGIDAAAPILAAAQVKGTGSRPGIALAAPPGAIVWDAVNVQDGVRARPDEGQTVVVDADPPDRNLGQVLVSRRVAAEGAGVSAWSISQDSNWSAVAVALRPKR